MAHYLDRFANCKMKINKTSKDPDAGGAFGPEETGPNTLYQDLSCFLSKKNMTESYIASKYIGQDVYQVLIKQSLLIDEDNQDLTKRIDAEDTGIEITEYNGNKTHNFVGKYRIVGYDPSRGRDARRDLHAKFFLTRIKSIDDILEND